MLTGIADDDAPRLPSASGENACNPSLNMAGSHIPLRVSGNGSNSVREDAAIHSGPDALQHSTDSLSTLRSRSRSPAAWLRQKKGGAQPEAEPEDTHCSVAFTFDVAEHLRLRQSGRCPLLGLPMGTLPSNPQQNAQLGAPFVYSPNPQLDLELRGSQKEERAPLAGSKNAAVLADLSQRGYFVVSGLRHGFDFVVYEGDPVRHHGSYFVVVADSQQSIPPRQLVLWHRLAAAAHKTALLATLSITGTVRYLVISGEER
ncbi:unnamed protein product [Polarella glacialis]|uniref:tRNA-intron lyase n=1 Tax=Polarella glacialis TaxID=89957 RepID=A0A813L030_POLGL|nr:unnamed protein product [Polarella glacialis]CAE8632161.1 unnamed protein product [Polarella glacialis]CAE8714645.1 unnamed protein product [Polarella glacialis]